MARLRTALESTTNSGSASYGRPQGQRRWRSLTATDKIPPIHPGEILLEDFIEVFGITQNRLAVAIGITPRWIYEIVNGARGISANVAPRLSKCFGTSAASITPLQVT